MFDDRRLVDSSYDAEGLLGEVAPRSQDGRSSIIFLISCLAQLGSMKPSKVRVKVHDRNNDRAGLLDTHRRTTHENGNIGSPNGG